MIHGIYILIIVTNIGYGTSAMSQEFYSKEACENARNSITYSQKSLHKNETVCVPKE